MVKIILSFLALLLIPGCWSKRQEQVVSNNLLVINVLEKNWFDDCHIKGSVNVELDDLENYVKNLNKDTEIVFYCSNYLCSTSDVAAKQLLDLGFKKVWVYQGGIAEWYQQGLPCEGPAKNSYLKKQVTKLDDAKSDVPCIHAMALAHKMGIDHA